MSTPLEDTLTEEVRFLNETIRILKAKVNRLEMRLNYALPDSGNDKPTLRMKRG
jgi:hypothetical protein